MTRLAWSGSVLVLTLLLCSCNDGDAVFDSPATSPQGEWRLTQTVETTGCKPTTPGIGQQRPDGLDDLMFLIPGPREAISTQVSISVNADGYLEMRGSAQLARSGRGPAPDGPGNESRTRARYVTDLSRCPVLFEGSLDGDRVTSSWRVDSTRGPRDPFGPGGAEPVCSIASTSSTELHFDGTEFFGTTETSSSGCGQTCTTRIAWEATRCADCGSLGDCGGVQIGDDASLGSP